MKFMVEINLKVCEDVALRGRAWIEIFGLQLFPPGPAVALRGRAWIEI